MHHDHRNIGTTGASEGITPYEYCVKYKSCGHSGLDNDTKYNSIVAYTNQGKTERVNLMFENITKNFLFLESKNKGGKK